MRCRRCGNEIRHVPEHLQNLAEWICRECTNTVPRRFTPAVSDEPIRRQFGQRRRKEAA